MRRRSDDCRAAVASAAAALPPPDTTVEPVGAGGVPAEWVIAADVHSGRVLLYLHGGAYQAGSSAMLRRMIALISAAAQVRGAQRQLPARPGHPFSRRRGRRADCLPVPAERRRRFGGHPAVWPYPTVRALLRVSLPS